jgi:hypothetical protein
MCISEDDDHTMYDFISLALTDLVTRSCKYITDTFNLKHISIFIYLCVF